MALENKTSQLQWQVVLKGAQNWWQEKLMVCSSVWSRLVIMHYNRIELSFHCVGFGTITSQEFFPMILVREWIILVINNRWYCQKESTSTF
jgi:hypothetical protein